jgi:DNA-binding transcriptional LysR family regulator
MIRGVITSRQLEYFRAVAHELHFTRAAAALNIAQPALSQHIRKLERQLGLTLFERDRHGVELTPAGAALLEHAERILADIAAVDDELRDWEQGVRGVIRLGAARGVMTRLARVLARFCAEYPAVDVQLREETTAEMLADLYAGRLDAATLAALMPLPDGRLASHPLGAEPLVLVAGPGSPFASRRRTALATLEGVDLVMYGEGSAVRTIVASALADAGVTPRVRFETREYTTARVLVNAGLAVAVLPRSVALEPGPPVHVVDLEPALSWAPALAWSARRRPAPALAAFIDFAISALERDAS